MVLKVLNPLPYLLHVAGLHLLFYFSSVALLCIPELDSEGLLGITIFKWLLLLVEKAFDVTCYPGLAVRKRQTALTATTVSIQSIYSPWCSLPSPPCSHQEIPAVLPSPFS